MCNVKFKNSLPDPLVDLKFISIYPDLSSCTAYIPTDMERDHAYEIPMNVLATPLVDMVDLGVWKPQMNEMLAVEDERLLVSFDVLEKKRKLLAAESAAKAGGQGAPLGGAAAHRRPDVTWLRRTEYISSEFGKVAKKTGEGVTIAHQQPPSRQQHEINTKDDLISVIEEGFDPLPLEELVHPFNKRLKAVESIPVFLETGASAGMGGLTSFIQCLFDTSPKAQHGLGEVSIRPDADNGAILRAMSNPSDPSDSFVWYYLPTAEPMGAGDSDSSLAYVRDYDIQRNDKAGQAYALLLDQEKCHLVPITSQFHLRKRRLKAAETARQPHLLSVTRK